MKKILAAATILLLGACAQYQQGVEFTKDRIEGYCASTTELERQSLRSQLVYEDGSPMVEVHCEPHADAT